MYLYKIRRFDVYFLFSAFWFRFQRSPVQGSGKWETECQNTQLYIKESSGQDSVGTQGSYT